MNYNDFPILNNDEYLFLNEQYSTTPTTDRKTLICKVCQNLSSCFALCYQLKDKYNFKIKQTIESTSKVISRLYDNFSSIFNINTPKIKEITTFNLFDFIKKIINTCSLLNQWIIVEEKEYYKTQASKSEAELLECVSNICSALERSNIVFYKHM